MTLYEYLLKVKKGEPVNYPQLLKRLPPEAKVDAARIFKPAMVAKCQFMVSIIDQQYFDQLLANTDPTPSNRVQAAEAGDSHKVATSYSHLLLFHQAIEDDRPNVVVIFDGEINQPHQPKANLLIIENQENFFCYEALLKHFDNPLGEGLDLSNTDIVYGAGNQINKWLNFSFFEQYHTLFCAFDWDLGGLGMFKTLKSKLHLPVYFLQGQEMTSWHAHFRKRPDSPKQLLDAIALARSLGFDELAEAFKSTSRFLEQESWLTLHDNQRITGVS